MHPAFRSGKDMIVAGLLWSPVAFWTIILHRTLSGSTFLDSTILLVPPMILLLGIAISVWYICKGLPFEKNDILYFIVRHSLTMILVLAVWIGISSGYSGLLNEYLPAGKWKELFNSSIPLLTGMGIFTYLLSILIYYLALANERIRHAEREILQQQLEASLSELEALKTTIHPHFLFNSLNLISPLIKQSPDRASELISHLSEFLIYSFEYSIKKNSTVREEIEHIKNYLSVEKFRLSERLDMVFDIGEGTSDIQVPPLILLPVVENSIKHGISQLLEGGLISVKTLCKEEHLVIIISNPYEENTKKPRGRGHGLNNLKKRMKLYYKGEGGVLTGKKDNIFNVRIFIPVSGGTEIE